MVNGLDQNLEAMLEKYKYGLIGAGMMGHEHIRNIELIEHAEIVAIYEPDAAMRSSALALLPNAVSSNSVEELLSLQELDALVVASPNHIHAGQLAEIQRLRPLPTLMEKPLFTDSSDEKFILDTIQVNPNQVWVAMEYRYMPPIAKFIKDVQSATGGIKMLSIREHRFPFLPKVGDWNRFNANSGGTLVEKCCHFFDLMRHILKDDPIRVMASGGQSVNHLDERYDGQIPDIWDNAFVIVDFKQGARAMLDLCMFAEGSQYQEEISAVGPSGKIEAFVPGPARFWPEDSPEPTPNVVISPRHTKTRDVLEIPVDPTLLTAGDHNGATYYQHLNFLEVVKGNAIPEVSLDDGRWAVKMGMAAQESASTGRAVSF